VAGKRGPTTWQDDVLRALGRTFHASREMILRRLLTLDLASATEILAKFPQLVNTRRSRSVADPFVIALARVQGLAVVTAERASLDASRRGADVPPPPLRRAKRCDQTTAGRWTSSLAKRQQLVVLAPSRKRSRAQRDRAREGERGRQ
jgi:hypothetical protein